MSNLYFLKYNNYYNRLLLREDNLTAYLPYMVSNTPVQNVNFIPGNGVNTIYTANLPTGNAADYLLVVEDNNIKSRWFIIDSERLRNGQYSLTLRRDLLADYYEPLLNATAFIEKATLEDNDPLIFNKEAMTFNQIKKKETLIKDETECAWIVGYYARTSGDSVTSLSGTTQINRNIDTFLTTPISEWEYYDYIGKNVGEKVIGSNARDRTVWTRAQILNTPQCVYYGYNVDSNKQNANYKNEKDTGYFVYQNTRPDPFTYASYVSHYREDILAQAPAYYSTGVKYVSDTQYNDIMAQIGKVIETTETDGTNKYYVVDFLNSESANFDSMIQAGSLYNTLTNAKDLYNNSQSELNKKIFGEPNVFTYSMTYTITLTQLVLREISNKATITYNISNNRYIVNDAPYDMFAIPYSSTLNVKNTGSNNADFICSQDIAFSVANAIGEKYKGAGVLYDIQLLPYCPVRSMIVGPREIDLFNDTKSYSLIKDDNDNTVSVILNCTISSFEFDIPLVEPIVISNPKIQSQTDMYRLCSPNYNGVFEFNAAKNQGVSRFNVDCTYLPFNPYIHVNPDFKGLYGQDFNDNRGLILGGDFSLAIVTDQWETYKLQNKNYEQIFNRQIKNLEVNNAVQREREIWSATTGAINAGISGSMTGALVAGPWGALAGLATAGVSAAAGARDVALGDKLRQETIDYTKDQFGYSLGNIQALPDGLAKTTAYTANNKIFPFLEFYTCTDEEKQALIDKVYYNGMTVMRIGKVQDYIKSTPTYIKGKLIRVDETGEDFMVINELANEFNKGVRM